MARRTIDLEVLGNAILVAMYEEFMRDGETDLTASNLSEHLPNFPTNAVSLELKNLARSPNVTQVMRRKESFLPSLTAGQEPELVATGKFRITRDGIDEVAGWSETLYDDLLRDHVVPVLLDDDSDEPEDADDEEADWMPLPIDRSTAEYEEAIDALEAVVETIESDNGYAANDPGERNQIVWSLKEGLQAIKAHLPSWEQVQSMVIAPLKFIVEKFATSAMGEAAKAALPKILGWLSGLRS